MFRDLAVVQADGKAIAMGEVLRDRTLLIALRHLA